MKQRIWAWVRTLGGVAIIGVLLWRLGSSAFLDGLRVINVWTLLGAFGIGLLATVASAWRWVLAARGLGIRMPLHTAVADYYQSLFLNATLPGGLLGDVHRAVSNGRENGDVGRGVRAVVLERFAGQVAMFVIGGAVLLAHPWLLHYVWVRVPGSFLVAFAGVVVGLTLLVVSRPGLRRKAAAVGRDVRHGLLAKRNWIWVGFSSAVVVISHLATFVLAARAAGATAPVGQLLPLMVLALLVMAVPLSVGGWGPREGFMAWAFGLAGLGAQEGLTIAVVYGLFALVAALPGIAVLGYRLFKRRRAAAAPVSPAVAPTTTAPAAPTALALDTATPATDRQRLALDAGSRRELATAAA
ncbi:YbhN family protein [Cryptosporangium sp. NPDC048952]|uniref:lysylphosphatidylglycerol synthase transmembrane domain-containing protein n=1 Tax=Cryptosporangium sp. NPDC048952 TaxID=3363961 RepID=UPI00371EF835